MTARGATASPTCAMFQSMRSSTARTSLRDWLDRLAHLTGRDPGALLGFALEQIAERRERAGPLRVRPRAAHAGCAARARATFWSTSLGSVIATERIVSPVAGLRTSSECGCAGGGTTTSGSGSGSASRPATASSAPGRRRAPRRPCRPARPAGSSAPPSGPAGASSWRTSPAAVRRPSASSTSANERNPCQRSARCLSSPGVCAPRNSSTPNSADSGRSSSSTSSATCRCLITRCPAALTRRVSCFSRSASSARSTVSSE